MGQDGARERHRIDSDGSVEASLDAHRKLKRATVFVLCFFVVEVVGGLLSGSLAVITDAAHLLTDISGFILAIVAQEISVRPANDKLTYGWVRAEVLSALFSTMFIIFLSSILAYEAIKRLIDYSNGEGQDIDGAMMAMVAGLGLVVNVALLWILGEEHHGHGHGHGHGGHSHTHDHSHGRIGSHTGHDEEEGIEEKEKLTSSEFGIQHHAAHSHHDYGQEHHDHGHSHHEHGHSHGQEKRTGHGSSAEEEYGTFLDSNPHNHNHDKPKARRQNLNVNAALLHAISDMIQSVGVLLAGIVIWLKPAWQWFDPISTLFFTVLVVNSTRKILSDAVTILLEGVPDEVDYDLLRVKLQGIDGVTDVHCLHVWSLTLGRTIVTAHIKAINPDLALEQAHIVCERAGIFHSTIQVQRDDCVDKDCQHSCVSTASKCC